MLLLNGRTMESRAEPAMEHIHTVIEPSSNDRAAIEAVIQRLPDGWNRRDAQLFASAFTEPHDYVAVGGFLAPDLTRHGNAQAHEKLWQTRFAEGSIIRFDIVTIDQPLPGLALAIAKIHNDYIESGDPRSHDTVLTMVLLKSHEGWRIRQFNNNLVLS